MNRSRRDEPAPPAATASPITATIIQRTFEEGLRFHRAGKLAEAENLYRQVLAVDPRQPEALHLLGVLAREAGRHDVAAELIGAAIAIDGTIARYHLNLGSVLQDHGRLAEAVAAYESAIRLQPDYALAHYNLAIVLKELGRLEDSIAASGAAIRSKPDFAAAHSNLGNALKEAGRFEEALTAFATAIRIDPDFADAHYNLGNALKEIGRSDDAVLSYRAAIRSKPDFAAAHSNLGNVLKESGRADDALAAYHAALRIDPDLVEAHTNLAVALKELGRFAEALDCAVGLLRLRETTEAKLLFAECVKRMAFAKIPDGLSDLLVRALSEGWTRPNDLAAPVARMLTGHSVIAGLIGTPAFGENRTDEQVDEAVCHLAGVPLLMCLLRVTLICDAPLEGLLTACRAAYLRRMLRSSAADLPAEPVGNFLCALAQQCFINDYAFSCTEGESRAVERLQTSVLACLSRGNAAGLPELATLACYVPLYSLPDPTRLLNSSWPEPAQALLRAQIAEPLQEQRLRTGIPRLTSIETGVSALVREQYEEHPYPRWMKAGPVFACASIDHYIRRELPRVLHRMLGRREPDILVAGCGTGQHPIQIAQTFPQARILAVDLSLASLGYALRKTHELGLANVQFAQADLLKLREIGREFDVIESVGVLHHLGDPEAGLGVLVSILRPDGLLKLGLYSERARQGVASLRAIIAERGYRADAQDIRRCRQDLLDLPSRDVPQAVMRSIDFASISGCRDLLFHAQEHVLTLPKIARWLDRFDLTFLGFEGQPETDTLFRRRFPAPGSETDLGLWDLFEIDHPDSFIGMYQFWAQKKG
jgi:tetratricopeptide (TPR) repeat protein/SAM-dependent methyltransferase